VCSYLRSVPDPQLPISRRSRDLDPPPLPVLSFVPPTTQSRWLPAGHNLACFNITSFNHLRKRGPVAAASQLGKRLGANLPGGNSLLLIWLPRVWLRVAACRLACQRALHPLRQHCICPILLSASSISKLPIDLELQPCRFP
jgi:hypothetical protein